MDNLPAGYSFSNLMDAHYPQCEDQDPEAKCICPAIEAMQEEAAEEILSPDEAYDREVSDVIIRGITGVKI